jgi:threonine/homoserine efflux transporter RhtA
MSEQPPKESLLSVIIIAVVVLGTMSLTIWNYRQNHPDMALMVAAWIFGAFTVVMILHLRKMAKAKAAREEQQAGDGNG